MSIVPIIIRQHLVPFFFKESEGREANYGKYRVKSVLFSPTVSSVGRIIRLLMIKAEKPLDIKNFNLYLTILDDPDGKKYVGRFYKHENGRNSFLMLPPEANDYINDLLEDIFRMAFISYVNGNAENNNETNIIHTINSFIDKYELLEFGYCTDTMRRLYYREKKKSKILARFQHKKAANTLNLQLMTY